MINARRYKHSISLLHTLLIEDDYGKGAVQSTIKVLDTFAAITPLNVDSVRYENTQAIQAAYRFVIRWTDKVFNVIEWQGKQYSVNSVINVGESNTELIINAQRAE
jgi:hypothetical protein